MISELFGMVTANMAFDAIGGGVRLNMSRNRVKSISSFSSNSIFYFTTVMSEQVNPEEGAMTVRMIERAYASFVVACISLMPFHRVRSGDMAAVEDYLAQLHQNMGIGRSNAHGSKAMMALMAMDETSITYEERAAVEDFLLECWQEAHAKQCDPIKVIYESVSLQDMFSTDSIDPKTRAMQKQFNAVNEEVAEWGFIGEAGINTFDTNDGVDGILDESIKGSDKFDRSMQTVSKEVIDKCTNASKLHSMKRKLEKLKEHQVTLVNRYKTKSKREKTKSKKFKLKMNVGDKIHGSPQAIVSEAQSRIKAINARIALIDGKIASLNKDASKTPSKEEKPEPKKKDETPEEKAISENFGIPPYIDMLIDECVNEAYALVTKPDSEIFEVESLDEFADTVVWGSIAAVSFAAGVAKVQDDLVGGAKYTKTDAEKKLIANDRKEAKQWFIDYKKTSYRGKATADEMYAQYVKQTNALPIGVYIKLIKFEELRVRTLRMLTPTGKLNEEFDFGVLPAQHQSQINPYTAVNDENRQPTWGKEVFTDMEMKKANDAVPTFAKATVNFVIDETEETIARDVLIGIKAYIHKTSTKELMDDIYQCIIRKRKFLRFVKFITGEERSLADLLFCFKNLKADAISTSKGETAQWRAAIKRRKRWANMSVPYLTKEYTPNATLIITMNEVEFLKSEYGIDMMTQDHVNAIMSADFLLGFVIIDQANEVVYVTYDGFNAQFQEYTYAMLERESQSSDRMMRELYRSFSR